jgi:hypothetical protein
MNEFLEIYIRRLERKENRLNRLQQKANDIGYDMDTSETIELHVLQAEVRLLKGVIEDFSC